MRVCDGAVQGPMIMLPLILFGGLFVNVSSIPDYFTWLEALSPMR